MHLISSPASPYGRKARLTAHVKGLMDKLTVITADEAAAGQGAPSKNPLAKIPVLVLDDGTQIYDSHVICEYLDAQVAQPALFPGDGPARWDTLTRAALADGIMDAALLLVYEKRYRPEEKWHPDWMAMQQTKIAAAVAAMNAAPPPVGNAPDYGHITLACALGYLDFRHEGAWRNGNDNLVAWLDEFASKVPGFDATRPD